MYAMRYGTVPIAHATGGLIDTIQDYNPFAKGKATHETIQVSLPACVRKRDCGHISALLQCA
jgi:starch synthase